MPRKKNYYIKKALPLLNSHHTAKVYGDLGTLYELGDVLPKNRDEGERLLKLSSNLGHSTAQYNYAILYFSEYQSEAIRLLRISAEEGNLFSMDYLAYLYKVGNGVERDTNESLRLYKQSADQGSIMSQYNLALMYRNGEGVKQDLPESNRLLKLSADNGYFLSMMSLVK